MKVQRAQGLVEFAIIGSLFFLLFFVILDGGRAIYTFATVAESVREGAHQAELTDSTDAQVRAAINAHAALLGDLGGTASITPSGSRIANQPVTITVTYQYRTVTPFLSQFGPINFSSTTKVIAE
jgi:Flp pilus assembly protein TadG